MVKSLKLKFKRNFGNWSMVSILLLRLGEVMKWMFGQDFDVKVWSKCWCLVEILKFVIWSRFVYFGLKVELNPRVRCAFGNVFNSRDHIHKILTNTMQLMGFNTKKIANGRKIASASDSLLLLVLLDLAVICYSSSSHWRRNRSSAPKCLCWCG